MTLPHLTLSVVIPCYNEAEVISACIDALVAQVDPIDEIIIVDNNSSDATTKIIAKYQKTHNAIRLLHEKIQGVQFARNTGFNAAKSDIIGRIDADTILEPDWSRNVKNYYADTNHRDFAIASGYSMHYDLPFPRLTETASNLFMGMSNQRLAGVHSIYGANMTLRRPVWGEIKASVCMQRGIMEDQDLGYHVMKVGKKTGAIKLARAKVSGRRMRMSPLRYWRYNQQWWKTYAVHGQHSAAWRIRIMTWFGNILQAFAWAVLLWFDPTTRRFSIRAIKNSPDERIIP